jgi:hypothetical protein
MSAHEETCRRRVSGMSVAAGGLASFGIVSPLLSQKLRRTQAQVLGACCPVFKPLDQDADLTVIQGRPRRLSGNQ